MTIIELRQKRAALVKNAREIVDKIDAESRDWTAEENNHYENIMKDVDNLANDIKKRESVQKLEKEMKEVAEERTAPIVEDKKEVENRAFRNFLANGKGGLTEKESRALQMDSDPAGGYTVAPEQWLNELWKNVDNETFMMSLADVRMVDKAHSLGFPVLDNDPADPTWTSELSFGSEDTNMTFGKRELMPNPLAQYLKVSNKLIRASGLNIDQLVNQRLAYKMAVVLENAFLNGSGAMQPLGVFKASANGINTDRDASTGNTISEIRFDGLMEAKYSIKGQYWPKLKWIFHRDAVKMIRKLKDGEGQYLWSPSVQQGAPDMILGMPVLVSEYAPNTFTTGLYVGILGDFKKYMIAAALNTTIQRLVELYAATNQTGYLSRSEVDGMPVISEAFARVTLA